MLLSSEMPEPHRRRDNPLSRLNESRNYVRVACAYCKRRLHFFPDDLIRVFGDVDVDSIAERIKCEGCGGRVDVKSFSPTGSEAVGMRMRRLVAIKIQHVPVWRDE